MSYNNHGKRKISDADLAAIRERRRALLAAVKGATDEDRAILALLSLVNTEGHNLSGKNALLIAMQAHAQGLPVPSIVGGFRQWRARGRVVARGMRGMAVCYPRVSRDNDNNEHVDGYSWGTVFDIAQTVPAGSEEVVNMADNYDTWAKTWADIGAADLDLWQAAAKDDETGTAKTPVVSPVVETAAAVVETAQAVETAPEVAAPDNGGNSDNGGGVADLLAAFAAA